MSFDDWNEYFNEVFQGAWECYSDANDGPYKQWIKKGARWAIDFQRLLLQENKKLKQQNEKLVEVLEFYADPESYNFDGSFIESDDELISYECFNYSWVSGDDKKYPCQDYIGGKRARDILEEIESE